MLEVATTSPIPPYTVGVYYEHQLAATGGDGNYEWKLKSGSLPGGLTLSPSGLISGTPTGGNMSVITNEMVREAWKNLYRKGHGKEQIKQSPLPTPAQVKAILQAIEDSWENGRAAMKADMDAAAGVTLAGQTAKAYGRAWLHLKANRGG